jgi:hypothetical protein
VSIDQFSLVPSVVNDGENVEFVVQTTVADQIWLRRSIGGGSYEDILGSSTSYYSITPGVLNTNLPIGAADYFLWGGSPQFLLLARLSSDFTNSTSATRTLTINAPAGAGGSIVPESNTVEVGSSINATLLVDGTTTGTYSISTGSASTGSATYSPSSVTTFVPGGEIEAQAPFSITGVTPGTLVIEARDNTNFLVATYTITVVASGGTTAAPTTAAPTTAAPTTAAPTTAVPTTAAPTTSAPATTTTTTILDGGGGPIGGGPDDEQIPN